MLGSGQRYRGERSRRATPWVATLRKRGEGAVSVSSREIKGPARREELVKKNAYVEETQRAQAMLDFVGDAVMSTDTEARITSMNRAAEVMTGFRREDAMGRALEEVFNVKDIATRKARPNLARQAMETDRVIPLHNGALLVTLDGRELAIENSAAPLHNEKGEVVGALVMFHDTRYSTETTAKMAYLAQHDTLTGLLNRHAFSERFEQAAALAKRHRKKMVMLFIDLDNFKDINDSMGHITGDAILKTLGRQLLGCVRVTDHVCRHGGDEFVVLLSDLEQPEQAFAVIDKVREAAADLMQVEGKNISLELSIGVSVYPDNGESLEQLLPHADAAMYRVKASHRLNRAQASELLSSKSSRSS